MALAGGAVFFLLAFGLRSIVHYRRTGSTGFVGISGRPGSAEWIGGVLFIVALVAAGGAPILQLAGTLLPHTDFDAAWVRAAGIALFLVGISGTLWAQFAMGNSWRIGVDTAVKTSLVATGPFRFVRNPIFSAMTAAVLGLALLVPNAASLLAVVSLIVALEIQVRLVEEPYLMRQHGDSYRSYAAGTGRFLPGIGRLADGWDRRRLIAIGLAAWSLMTALSGLARDFGQLAAARIGVGIGEASASPAAFSLLSDYFPAARRATVLALYSSGIYLGAGVGIGIGGLIVNRWDAMWAGGPPPFGLHGWQVAFFAVGIWRNIRRRRKARAAANESDTEAANERDRAADAGDGDASENGASENGASDADASAHPDAAEDVAPESAEKGSDG